MAGRHALAGQRVDDDLDHAGRRVRPARGRLLAQVRDQVVEHRSRPFHAADPRHRPVVAVADPHRHGVLRREAEGPVVAVIGAGAGLGRHRVGEAQRRFEAEAAGAGLVVAQDVGHQPHRHRVETRGRRRDRAVFQDADRQCLALARQRGVGGGQVEQAYLRVAEGEAETVARRVRVEPGDPGRAQEVVQRGRPAVGGQQAHRRQVQRVGQRVARGHRPVVVAVEVARFIRAGRGGERRRHVGQHRPRAGSRLEGQQIGEWLERRTGGSHRQGVVDLTRGRGKIAGPDERPHRSRPVLDHHHRPLAHLVAGQAGDMVAQAFLGERLERGVDGGVHRAAGGHRQGTHHGHQMGGVERPGRIHQPQGFGARPCQRIRRSKAQHAHPLQDPVAPGQHAFGAQVRVQPGRRLGQGDQCGAFGQRQVGQRFAEIGAGRLPGAALQVAEVCRLQPAGKDAVLGPAGFQGAGQPQFLDFPSQRAGVVAVQPHLHQLHGQRGGARDGPPVPHALAERTYRRQRVEPVMAGEPFVLRRLQGRRQHRWDIRRRQRLPEARPAPRFEGMEQRLS